MIAERVDQSQPLPPMTQTEVAEFLSLFREPTSRREVQTIEYRAIRKLARLEEIRQLLPDVLGSTKLRTLDYRD
jgi:hypothetical protein